MDVRATEVDSVAAAPASAPVAAPLHRPAPRGTGRLFRKYFILILALVTGALLIPSSISLYFSYRETLDVLHEVQREKALAAAGRIEQYIVQVQSQLRGAALPQLGAEGTEQRRLEFLKLLKQVPDVTDIAYIGADGCEKTQVSRLSMDAAGDCLRERGREPAFLESTPGRPWYGRVYFRKETEPYMQIAVRTGGEKGPVTVADVNLKFMWDVITRIKIGEKGKAYVVDSAGFLIADPDIGLVLRKTDLSGLAHVKAALAGIAGGDAAVVSRDVGGTEVLSAHASIDPLGWKVFVEQPASEVLARLNTSILRIGVLLLGGLIISALVALFLARGMARPIRELQEGAQLIGAGKLDHTIDVKTGDELEALAGQFNRMTGQLRESYAGLERKVDERTRELTHSLEQQTAISEILRVISGSPTDVQPVLDAVAERAARLCNAPYARILLVDGEVLRPAAEYSVESAPPSLPVPFDRTSLSGRAAMDRKTLHYADIVPLLDAEFPGARENIVRLGSRAVLSVPLMREGGAYGAIFLYRREPGLFAPDQVALVETFARQAAIAIDNVRLFNETREALDQQRASGEVLSAISNSIADTAPVFDAILQGCERLFAGTQIGIILFRDGMLDAAALRGPGWSEWKQRYPRPLARDTASGIAILERRVVDFPDVDAADFPPEARDTSQFLGYQSIAAAPLIVEGRGIGALWVGRPVKGAFGDKQLAMLRSFADQAVIAIENARLFNETKEALDQQRASGEVLAAISNSISDTQPVFDVILASCERLFSGHNVGVMLVRDDGMLDIGAYRGPGRDELTKLFPVPVDHNSGSGTAILERRVVDYPDIDADDVPAVVKRGSPPQGVQSMVFAPMLSEGKAIGALWVARRHKGSFGDKPMALLRSFADQAVIAIQNARLVNETREALDQQRASGEILSAISSSIADTKPVFDVILSSCERLFDGHNVGVIIVRDDGRLDLGAYAGRGAQELATEVFPMSVDRMSGSGTAVLECRIIEYPDVDAGNIPPMTLKACQIAGMQSIVFAPMLSEGRALGVLWVGRTYKGQFGDKATALLRTFADQAVIAIRNARLFRETHEALEQQTGTAAVLKVISRTTFDLDPVLATLIENATRLAKSDSGFVYIRDGDLFHLAASHGASPQDVAYMRANPIPPGPGTLTGRTALAREVVQIEDAASDPTYMRTEAQKRIGFRTMLGVPMFREGEPIGVVVLWRNEIRAFGASDVRLASSFADQAVIAIENVRLFREIREKSRQLEIASQHKSEFLANMSHELRTPLNAIIGFSEVLIERMFGELNEKQDDYLKDIHSSGKHLLSLINDILDLSKVEAGRMELEPGTFDVPSALANAMTLVRERAQRHAIALGVEVAPEVTEIVADERKFKQILLNLLTNAVKFTPDGGRVDVFARRVGDLLEVAVRDTGIGIAKEDHDAVFEEFRQVGRNYTNKQEGTGLGLALTRRFVELHAGTLRLESEPGKGSTFTFTIPFARSAGEVSL